MTRFVPHRLNVCANPGGYCNETDSETDSSCWRCAGCKQHFVWLTEAWTGCVPVREYAQGVER